MGIVTKKLSQRINYILFLISFNLNKNVQTL